MITMFIVRVLLTKGWYIVTYALVFSHLKSIQRCQTSKLMMVQNYLPKSMKSF